MPPHLPIFLSTDPPFDKALFLFQSARFWSLLLRGAVDFGVVSVFGAVPARSLGSAEKDLGAVFVVLVLVLDPIFRGVNFFGSNNLKEKKNLPVTERFTKSQKGVNKHIKLLVDTKKIIKYIGCHFIQSIPGTYTKDTKGKIITTLFNENGDNTIAQINHYKVKSEEEFKRIVKRPRPDAIISDPNKMWRSDFNEEFKKYNFNEIEDLTAMNIYKQLL